MVEGLRKALSAISRISESCQLSKLRHGRPLVPLIRAQLEQELC